MIKISSKTKNKDVLKTLLELITYYNLSYPIGLKDECQVKLDDKTNKITLDNTIYQCDDQLYINLQLLSNKVIAYLYKLIEDETDTE